MLLTPPFRKDKENKMTKQKGVWGEQEVGEILDNLGPNDEDFDDITGQLKSLGVDNFDDLEDVVRVLGSLDDGETLQRGDFFRDYPNGPLYRVSMVNTSRARCILIPEKGVRIIKAPAVMNISPRACVIRVDPSITPSTPAKEQTMTTAAGIPVASKSTREREKERKSRIATKKDGAPVRPLAGAAAKSKAKSVNKTPKTVRKCACGCGEETMGHFYTGHDARFKAWMVKIERGVMQIEELPKALQKAYEFKKRGPGFVTTTNYKGEKHSGYDKPKA
jgi:hypothetical protein